jgi:chromosome segregation ATPase
MSRPRRPSNTEPGRPFRKVIPDSYPDDYRNRGRDRDIRRENSFYRRDYSHSREQSRTFNYDRSYRSHSFGENAELGHERLRLASRQSVPDRPTFSRPSYSPESRRNSRQSSPKLNHGSQPISPRDDIPRSGAATPVTTTPSSALASELPIVDKATEELTAGSKIDLPDQTAVKDPRLRRINTVAKQSSEPRTTTPTVASPQPLTPAVNKTTPAKISTSSSSVTRTFTPLNPDTPVTGSSEVINPFSALPDAVVPNHSTEPTDVTMSDANQASPVVTPAAEHPLTTARPPQGPPTSSNIMESFVKLMTKFADQVSTTSVLKYKKDLAKQKSSRCKYNDRRNRENFKDYPVTIEQGALARQLAEQELASSDQKLNNHVGAQNELARVMAEIFVSQIEQRQSAQDTHSEYASALQKKLDRVEELSADLTSALAEAKKVKLNAAKSAKEAYELVERATSTCKGAQQAAQKTLSQVNDLTTRVNEVFGKVSTTEADTQKAIRNVTTLNRRVSEDQAQLSKIIGRLDRLEDNNVPGLPKRIKETEDDVRSLWKRTAETKDDVKSLWDDRASPAVLQAIRKEVNEDMARLKESQKDMVSQVESLESDLKKFRQSYETLAPEVEAPAKKIGEFSTPKAPDENTQEDPLAQELRPDMEDLRRSFHDLSQKFESSASLSDLATMRESIASLQTKIQNLNTAAISELLEAYRRDAEADHEDLKDLTKEVDELHAGQDRIRETVTMHNEDITKRVNKAEKDLHNISEEVKVTFDRAKEEAESIAKQINGMSKKAETTMTATTARPTPPSAPPTPQMHPAAQLPGRGPSPIIDNSVLSVRLNEVARDFLHLRGYVDSQFSASPNLPATLNSMNQALLSLQSRYNNLTTEPVVRAMVQQMQLMYPYASTAQTEIRDVRAAVSELEKLPPKIGLLTTQVDLHTKDIARLDQKVDEHDKGRSASDNKQERLVGHVKEERDNLKQHVQEQYEKLKQHMEKQHEKMGRIITATKEESVLSVAQVAAKVTQLETVADAWIKAKTAEILSQPSDKEARSKPVTQLKVNGPPAPHPSPRHHGPSTPTRASSTSESEFEALLKQYEASTRPRTFEAKNSVSDTEDSDRPLALTRTNSSNSIPPAPPTEPVPGTSGKRKRARDTSNDSNERQPLWEVPGSPSKRKAPRRS